MKSSFKRNFNSLGFRSPRWQIVNKIIFDPAQLSRFRVRHHLNNFFGKFRKNVPPELPEKK